MAKSWWDEVWDWIDEKVDEATDWIDEYVFVTDLGDIVSYLEQALDLVDKHIVDIDPIIDVFDWTKDNVLEPLIELEKWIIENVRKPVIKYTLTVVVDVMIGFVLLLMIGTTGSSEEEEEEETLAVRGPDSGDTTLNFSYQGAPMAWFPTKGNDSFLQHASKPASESQLNQAGLRFKYKGETMYVITPDSQLYVRGVALRQQG